jgi:hypothetical protein
MGKNAQRKREERDLRRVRNGGKRRTSMAERRRDRQNNVREPSATELAQRDAALFSQHGLILPPQVSGGLRIVRRR